MKKVLLLLLVLFSVQLTYSQNKELVKTNCKYFVPDLIPILVGKKYGYCDKNKKIIIPAKYDLAEPFMKDDCERLNFEGDSLLTKFFENNFATVTINKRRYRIDTVGKIVYEYQKKHICDYSYNSNSTQYFLTEKDGLVGVINNNKEIIINELYSNIYLFNSFPFIVTKNNLYGLVDSTGEIFPCKFSSIYLYEEYISNSVNLLKFSTNGKGFFVDFCGNEYIK